MGCACKLKQYERICYDVKYHSADWMFFGIWTKLGFVFRWNKNGILFKGETIWNERHIGLNVTTITTLHESFLESFLEEIVWSTNYPKDQLHWIFLIYDILWDLVKKKVIFGLKFEYFIMSFNRALLIREINRIV